MTRKYAWERQKILTASISLREELIDMGMRKAFEADANFQGISSAGALFISNVFHKAYSIRDTETNTVLFMGHVKDPEQMQ